VVYVNAGKAVPVEEYVAVALLAITCSTAGTTLNETPTEVLAPKTTLPLVPPVLAYAAVMVCRPAATFVSEKLQPLTSADCEDRVQLPIAVDPDISETVPFGAVEPDAAVTVTVPLIVPP